MDEFLPYAVHDMARDSVVHVKERTASPRPSPYLPPQVSSPLPQSGSAPAVSSGYDSSPQISNQLMQMQNQMSMMSQVMAMQSHQPRREPETGQRDSMLCFSLGERLGALNKHEEITALELKDLQGTVQESAESVTKVRESLKLLEANIAYLQEKNTDEQQHVMRVEKNVQKIFKDVLSLGKDQEHDRIALREARDKQEHFLAEAAKQERRTRELIAEAKAQHASLSSELSHAIEAQREMKVRLGRTEEKAADTGNALSALEASLRNERVRTEQQMEAVTGRLDAACGDMTATLTRCEHEMRRAQERHAKQMEARIQALGAEFRQQLNHVQQSLQQQQGQLLSMGQAGMGTGIGGSLLSLFLGSMMPFLPYDRLDGLVRYAVSYVGPLSSSTSFRGVWGVAVGCSIGARVLQRFCPLVSTLAAALLGLDRLHPWTRMVLRLGRIALELGLILQLYALAASRCQHYYSESMEKVHAALHTIQRWVAMATYFVVGIAAVLLVAAAAYAVRTRVTSTLPVPAWAVVAIPTATSITSLMPSSDTTSAWKQKARNTAEQMWSQLSRASMWKRGDTPRE
eukprot:TRINITY_DN23067_c0_g1_i1.p1 TRINITY_DN23067_c0_g1~~TRINITY_DN23067_c0_g1_i1.p1  ORF type:complete len:573 (+),score=157.31 TRINITY_DN23067_c0_g1_i1:338-2056(+)